MTPNIFKNIMYDLKTIVNSLSPKIFFYSNQLSNQLEVNNNNYSANGSKMYTYMAGTSNLARNMQLLIFVFFPKIASVPF